MAWISQPSKAPKNKFRQSLAVYYLTDIKKKIDRRSRALFAPDENQKKDKKVLKLIIKRSKVSSSKKFILNNISKYEKNYYHWWFRFYWVAFS